MKKILFPMLAVAALVAAPAAYARSMNDNDGMGSWRVLEDTNTQSCFVSNHQASSGEAMISGPYSSESQALSAAGSALQCASPSAHT